SRLENSREKSPACTFGVDRKMNEIKRTHPASSTGCVLLLLGCLKSTTAAAMAVGHSGHDSSRTAEKAAICRAFRA
ncbi:MAG: hypothetical protein KBH68_02325, partial [Trichococcus sp.]|nr:hypothetical protein [Trichococcus sp.]